VFEPARALPIGINSSPSNILKKMKQVLFVAFAAFLMHGCKPATTETASSDTAMKAAPPEENVDYAYTIDHPDNWETGSKQNTATVLKSLKAFENNDIATCMQGFADTVRVEMDGFEATLSNDSLKAMFAKERGSLKSMKVNMEDWESVVSKDKSMEYVSLWYKQYVTDANGKVDSLECMDDLRMKNGKIALINEKVRHYPSKK
jgi:hypothetical protein